MAPQPAPDPSGRRPDGLDQRPPGWRESLERLAELMGPLADDAQIRTTIDAIEPDEMLVARERRRLQHDWRVSGEDYVYPAHLIGPGAAGYPPPSRTGAR